MEEFQIPSLELAVSSRDTRLDRMSEGLEACLVVAKTPKEIQTPLWRQPGTWAALITTSALIVVLTKLIMDDSGHNHE
jgi:hypothetical protein